MSASLMSMTLNAAKYSEENRVDWYTIKSIVHQNKMTYFEFQFSVVKTQIEITFENEIDYDAFEDLCKKSSIKELEKQIKKKT